jgi:hypothetical protein
MCHISSQPGRKISTHRFLPKKVYKYQSNRAGTLFAYPIGIANLCLAISGPGRDAVISRGFTTQGPPELRKSMSVK